MLHEEIIQLNTLSGTLAMKETLHYRLILTIHCEKIGEHILVSNNRGIGAKPPNSF